MPNEKPLSLVRLVITDWSGVISDDRKPVYEANARMMEGYGLKRPTFEEWLELTRLTAADFFSQFPSVKDSAEVLNAKYKATFDQVRAEGIHPAVYADADAFMRLVKFHGMHIIVVSSHPESNLRREAREYILEHHITSFYGSVQDKATAISRVVGNFGVNPLHALYMGDTVFDIQAAKKAGVNSVGVSTGYHTHDRLVGEKPHLVTRSLTELLDHLPKKIPALA